jgi:predicted DNA-binding protein
MGKKKSGIVSSHTSMRLTPVVKTILLKLAKDTGWSEAKAANLLIEAGAESVEGRTLFGKNVDLLIKAAVEAHKVNVKADATKAAANAAVRKAAATLKPAAAAKVPAKSLDKKE